MKGHVHCWSNFKHSRWKKIENRTISVLFNLAIIFVLLPISLTAQLRFCQQEPMTFETKQFFTANDGLLRQNKVLENYLKPEITEKK